MRCQQASQWPCVQRHLPSLSETLSALGATPCRLAYLLRRGMSRWRKVETHPAWSGPRAPAPVPTADVRREYSKHRSSAGVGRNRNGSSGAGGARNLSFIWLEPFSRVRPKADLRRTDGCAAAHRCEGFGDSSGHMFRKPRSLQVRWVIRAPGRFKLPGVGRIFGHISREP
jgi:hypothetical protein